MSPIGKKSIGCALFAALFTSPLLVAADLTTSCTYDLGINANGYVHDISPTRTFVTYQSMVWVDLFGKTSTARRASKRINTELAHDCARHWMGEAITSAIAREEPSFTRDNTHCKRVDFNPNLDIYSSGFTTSTEQNPDSVDSLAILWSEKRSVQQRQQDDANAKQAGVFYTLRVMCTESGSKVVPSELVMRNVSNDGECNGGQDLPSIPFKLHCDGNSPRNVSSAIWELAKE